MLLAALAVLASCGRPDHGSGTPGDSNTVPVAGGELVFAFDGGALTQFDLDPHKSTFAPHHRIMRSIFDSLVVLLPNHQFGPWLAKSWEISPDGRTYTFHLRNDVKFHDGTRFDAEAVQFNLDRIANPANALAALTDLGPYVSTTVVDDFTARIELSAPFSPLLANLSKSTLGMMSPAAIRQWGIEVGLHPVGTGPFRLRSLQPGSEVALDRNPDYHWAAASSAHEGPAWLEHLTFKDVPEEATRAAVLRSGQAGAADLLGPQDILPLRKSRDFKLIERELLNHNYSLYFNALRAPWSDPRAREAFKDSLDIDVAVRTVYLGTFERAWSPLSPSIFGYDKSLEGAWKPDHERAARLLDELGWTLGADGYRAKDGKRLTVVFIDGQGNREKRLDLMTLFRNQLRGNGIDLIIESVPTMGGYLQRIKVGNYDLAGGSLFAPDPDVLRRVDTPAVRSLAAISKVNDPELTRLLEEGSSQVDPQARLPFYRDAQRLIIDRSYAIPVYVLIYSIATAAKVEGIAIDGHGFPVFNDAWIQP
jgi:peptide/nickel transport system substrate-binding protein